MIRLRSLQTVLWLVVLLLGVIAFRPLYDPAVSAFASEARFDHVQLVAGMFLYNGKQGLLLIDKRNGNAWFIAKRDEWNLKWCEPVLVTRIPLEKLDQPQ